MSILGPEGTVPLRSRVVQFPEDLLLRIDELFPDTGDFSSLFSLSRRGALFSEGCSKDCAPLLAELIMPGATQGKPVSADPGQSGSRFRGTDTCLGRLYARPVRLHDCGGEQSTWLHQREADRRLQRRGSCSNCADDCFGLLAQFFESIREWVLSNMSTATGSILHARC